MRQIAMRVLRAVVATKIRWGRALLGGFLAEAGIFAVMPIALQFGSQAPLYVIPPSCVDR